MAELHTETHTLNISVEAEVANYTYPSDILGTKTIEVTAKVELGLGSLPIQGNGVYSMRAYINGVRVTPNAEIVVPSGTTKTILISRPIPLAANDVLSLRVLGKAGDTSVSVRTSLRDATPITLDAILGVGSIPVDHNFGGTDRLSIKSSNGAPIDEVNIHVYRKLDYAAGNRSAEFVVGATKTTVDGSWEHPIMLDPGDYTLLAYKQGVIRAKAVNFTVS